MVNLIKEDINKVNTKTWVRVNEDARRDLYKKQFIDTHGGQFIYNGRYFEWKDAPQYEKTTDKYVVQTPDNKVDLVEVFSKYCKEKQLNKAAMYGTLKGTRNHHKGYKLVKIPD